MDTPDAYPVLKGRRVFVVEDEFAILLLVEDMLVQLGCKLVGSASRVSEALDKIACCEADLAVLDINVGGESAYRIAEALAARDIGFVFATGYANTTVSERWRTRPIVQKPFFVNQLGAALTRAMTGA